MTPLLALAAAFALAAPPPPGAAPRAGPREKCPVCGMFVAKYPDWIASIRFRDGGRAVFDGAKDLFKFWLEPSAWLPGRRPEDVEAMTVTDYYSLAPLDARAAHFVVGSDVHGPMGRELVPFASREGAEEFLRDHRGAAILRFQEVTPEVLAALDR